MAMRTIQKKCTAACLVAGILLSFMAAIMLYQAATHATIVDESPHIVAGDFYIN